MFLLKDSRSSSELEYVINRLSHEVFVIALRDKPSTIICPLSKALGLIIGSRVDTLGDNQNALRKYVITKIRQASHSLSSLNKFFTSG